MLEIHCGKNSSNHFYPQSAAALNSNEFDDSIFHTQSILDRLGRYSYLMRLAMRRYLHMNSSDC